MAEKGLSESVKQIEAARDSSRNEGFVASLFEARPRWDLLHMFGERKTSPGFPEYHRAFRDALKAHVDPDEVDRTGEISEEAIRQFRRQNAFALKVPTEYGGVGLTQSDYQDLAVLMGSWCGNTTALISANNSLGLSETLKQFGTPELKERWLPTLVGGWISGLALTEADAGTDVTKVEARAEPVYAGGVLTGWRLYGRKQWCTNAAQSDTEFLADVLVIIARLPDAEKRGKKRKQFGAFIVPTHQYGIRLIKRNRFSGLKAIYNGDIELDGVFVPAEDRIRDQAKAARGDDNDGLSIALTCITIGRLTLPSAGLGGLKRALWMARIWAKKRTSMGHPIGEFQSIADLIVRTAARVVALEAMTKLCGIWADHFGNKRLVIESGMVKVMGSAWYHQAIDDLFFIRAGRAFETVESLAARGDEPWAIERMRRDEIINLIFEGANPALTLQGGREGNAELVNLGMPGIPLKRRMASLPRVIAALASSLNVFGGITADLGDWGSYLHRQSRKLTRKSFLTFARYQDSLEHENQLALADLSRSAMGIFAGGAAQAYASWIDSSDYEGGAPEAIPVEVPPREPSPGTLARELADWFILDAAGSSAARRQIMPLARRILKGDAEWLEAGMV